jgi:hypothetical protein
VLFPQIYLPIGIEVKGKKAEILSTILQLKFWASQRLKPFQVNITNIFMQSSSNIIEFDIGSIINNKCVEYDLVANI